MMMMMMMMILSQTMVEGIEEAKKKSCPTKGPFLAQLDFPSYPLGMKIHYSIEPADQFPIEHRKYRDHVNM
jgi:hypothetical protein